MFVSLRCHDRSHDRSHSKWNLNPSSFLAQQSSPIMMGDGWETARHPPADRPSIMVRRDPSTNLVDSPTQNGLGRYQELGSVASHGVSRVILDTKHFRGNYPESVQVEADFHVEERILEMLLFFVHMLGPWMFGALSSPPLHPLIVVAVFFSMAVAQLRCFPSLISISIVCYRYCYNIPFPDHNQVFWCHIRYHC
jgi:hypothetical protein